ncbi:HtaA domain-containing protein [Corynebacterium mendelii]|uniref:HtaA domain-containing protein n=1 Tax=Corynebacterium mendelii TaxID=2765362 RepID=A0A939DZU9_9CORY|nr:HtaA domain-containing protein [Corynebacterium mendelii]MBN9644083.1 HtaA domain-containing protein [Corynebacterium mendelii]
MTIHDRPARRVAAAVGGVAACAAVSVVPLIGASPAVAADASCDTKHIAVTAGQFSWAFKETYLNYVPKTGQITAGDGADFNGSSFTNQATNDLSPIDSDSAGDIAFKGEWHFQAHPAMKDKSKFVLDTKLTNFHLKVSGDQATMYVDAVSRPATEMRIDADPTPFQDYKNIKLATFTMSPAANFGGSWQSTSTQAVIADEANKELFANYYQGENKNLAQITVNVTVDPEKCGKKPALFGGSGSSGGSGASGGGSGGSGSGTAAGPVWDFANDVNDRLVLANKMMDNTGKFMDNMDKLSERFRKDNAKLRGVDTEKADGQAADNAATAGASAGAGQAAPSAPAPGAASGASVSAPSGATAAAGVSAAPPSGGVSVGGGTPAPAAAAAGGATCDASSQPVEKSLMNWSVKDSFLTYITGSIARGRFETNNVGYNNSRFVFGARSGSVDAAAKSGQIAYGGSIHFTGHEGVLDMTIGSPVIQFNGTSGKLIANVQSSDMSGKKTDHGNVEFADLALSKLDINGNTLTLEGVPALTQTGVKAFADFYTVGQELAPISISAQLGAAGDCAAGGSGAATGVPVGAGGDPAGGADSTGADNGGGMDGAADAGALGSVNSEDQNKNPDSTSGGGSSFKIKSIGGKAVDGDGSDDVKAAGQQVRAAGVGMNVSPVSAALLVLACFVVAGAALTSFATKNPA